MFQKTEGAFLDPFAFILGKGCTDGCQQTLRQRMELDILPLAPQLSAVDNSEANQEAVPDSPHLLHA